MRIHAFGEIVRLIALIETEEAIDLAIPVLALRCLLLVIARGWCRQGFAGRILQSGRFLKSTIDRELSYALKIVGARCRLTIFRCGFERRRHADRLGHWQRLRFKLTANQDQPAEKDGPAHQEVGQNWHSHRLAPTAIALHQLWRNAARQSVSQITIATKNLRRATVCGVALFRDPLVSGDVAGIFKVVGNSSERRLRRTGNVKSG